MEKKLLYVQEREWRAPFKIENQIDSKYLKMIRGEIDPSQKEDDELVKVKLTRTYEGEVLKGADIPHGRGIHLIEVDGNLSLDEGWFIGGSLWGRGRKTTYK